MPAGKSGLNTDNKYVFLMERVYDDSRADLLEFMRLTVKRMILVAISTLVTSVICLVISFTIKEYSMNFFIAVNIALGIFNILELRRSMLSMHKKVTLTAPYSKILFGSNYNIMEVNQTDVLDTTLLLREYIGMIKSNRNYVNMIAKVNIFTSVLLLVIITLTILFI